MEMCGIVVILNDKYNTSKINLYERIQSDFRRFAD